MHRPSTSRTALRLALSLAAASACQPAFSATGGGADKLSAYSHLVPLTVSGKEALVRLRLPPAVYLNARSSDLRDLRVFDARGTALAFALVPPAPQALTKHRNLAVKIFPLSENGPDDRQSGSTAIRIVDDGSLVVIPSARTGDGKINALTALVLDLRQPSASTPDVPPTIDALRLTLPEGVSNYTARIALEVSDNLKQWCNVGESTVSWLANSATETLSSDRIEFAPTQARYARLRWLAGTPITFASISATVPIYTEPSAPLDHLSVQAIPGRQGTDLLYTSAPAIPVQTVGLQFIEQNVVLPAQLGDYLMAPPHQRGKPAMLEFAPSFRATFYQYNQSGTSRSSGDFMLPQVHQAQWVLRPELASTSTPRLRLGWSPATLVFMASGQPPYTLAVGRDKAETGGAAFELVAPGVNKADIASLEQAVAGPVRVQGTLPSVTSVADAGVKAARTRMAMLWGALLLGLIVLAAMVRTLLKQMR